MTSLLTTSTYATRPSTGCAQALSSGKSCTKASPRRMRRPFSSGYSKTPADRGATRTFPTSSPRAASALSHRSSVARSSSTTSNSSSRTGSSPATAVSSSTTETTAPLDTETVTSAGRPPETSCRKTRNRRSPVSAAEPLAGSSRPRYAMRLVSPSSPAARRMPWTAVISAPAARLYGLYGLNEVRVSVCAVMVAAFVRGPWRVRTLFSIVVENTEM